MARYNRHARHDYGYLRDVTPSRAFEEAYSTLPYGNRRAWPLSVNRLLIDAFAGRETLSRADAVDAIMAASVTVTGKVSEEFRSSRAGNALGWGVKLGFLHVDVVDGQRVWTMPDREEWFELDAKGKARQIRGLTDAQQADINRKAAAQEKARLTLQAKEAERVGPLVEAALHSLLRHDPGYVIPAGRPHGPYPEYDLALYLPTVTAPVPLVEVLPIVAEAHRDMEVRRQRTWLRAVEERAHLAKRRAEIAAIDAMHAARAAEQAVDDAALEDL
ncbi:hypothetical protein SAMN05216360_10337 [Methylobacterium phyllostachyos]|uniref:Uncharacterized protein n=1 Tax=Methylobacterium phyllostachyos TaxID=582672 RepID=A0A1G9V1X0_9HYPH|nr:hypothetical protein [Methylobacterium phyllostachyos]SDM65996.1 hypothetical protein SAMN05216360_10337 [Methylobacterium phyllostachyos]